MKRVFSAGGVVYKCEKDQLKILIIATKDKTVWSFPKGLIEEGEDEKEAALREIKEETGIEGRVVEKLGEVSYWFVMEGQKYYKTVKYFLVEYVGGEVEPSWEIDDVKWFSAEEVMERLSYRSDKEIFKKAIEKIHGIYTKT
ncbi:MAG: NUDIX hydrolase [Thermodesulfovibrio sp.]|nr:NUDIX hydrolase [Thermodesulfovibrio sp.]